MSVVQPPIWYKILEVFQMGEVFQNLYELVHQLPCASSSPACSSKFCSLLPFYVTKVTSALGPESLLCCFVPRDGKWDARWFPCHGVLRQGCLPLWYVSVGWDNCLCFKSRLYTCVHLLWVQLAQDRFQFQPSFWALATWPVLVWNFKDCSFSRSLFNLTFFLRAPTALPRSLQIFKA